VKRGDFVGHVAWTGAGILYVLGAEGIVRQAASAAPGAFSFVQISDSHIGYTGPANADVRGTLAEAIAAINAMPVQPSFVIHTGDVTHLSKQTEFDDARAIMSSLRVPLITIPGEHDVIGVEGPKRYAASFARASAMGRGWSSWDQGWLGSNRTWRRAPTTRRSWSSDTYRCSRWPQSGAGRRSTVRRRSECCSGSRR
jgi:hypothetical protein